MLALAACSQPSPTPTPYTITLTLYPTVSNLPQIVETVPPRHDTPVRPSPTIDIPATPSPNQPGTTATAAPARVSSPVQLRGETILAAGLVEPDDLLLAPDGSIYLSDIGNGTILRIDPGGKTEIVLRGLSEPEGMVLLPDGSLVIAEQGTDQLVKADLTSGEVVPLLKLSNPSGGLGVDGIALDAAVGQPATLIIPDSPNGRLLRSSIDGKQVQTIAGGFARPTGAFVEPDGSILVADENAGEVIRLHPDGSRQVLMRLPLADDVIEDTAGNIFAISISEGTIHMIQAGSQQDTVLVRGLSSPQGICFDPHGDLVVAESGKNRLARLQVRVQ